MRYAPLGGEIIFNVNPRNAEIQTVDQKLGNWEELILCHNHIIRNFVSIDVK
ncbi:predicted protein [Botrytis cinerea T4]|uniref:Uncharacterized protein n=1 Tax=Botryotinia fuckeliana (strain T4) TaxID=999810 RepID=G2XXT6_BOTF4|nr:predicted protein [Botrytis cinerea T4]